MSSVIPILHIVGAVANIGFGLYALLLPNSAVNTVNLSFQDNRGRSEFRVAYGGFWLGMGIAMLVLNQPIVYFAFGIAWLVGAASRAYALIADDPKIVFSGSFLVYWLIEVVIGVMLIV